MSNRSCLPMLEKVVCGNKGKILLETIDEFSDYMVGSKILTLVDPVKYSEIVIYNRKIRRDYIYCSPLKLVDTEIWYRELIYER